MWQRALSVLASSVIAACGFSAPVTGDAEIPTNITVGFEAASTQTDEKSGDIEIAVVLSEAADVPVSVSYEISGGTATPGADFNTVTSSVTIAPGELRGVFALTIISDTTEEDDETVDLVLVSPIGARIGAATHQVKISANELPRVQFLVTASNADEPTDAMLEVSLTTASEFDITVDYAVATSSTASSGADFELAPGTVTFTAAEQAAGTLMKQLVVDVKDDALDEDPETVVVTLAAATNAIILDTNKTRTHTIDDDDPEPNVSFTTAASDVAEGGTSIEIEVRLSAVSGRQVSVPFTLSSVTTATATADFTIVTGSPLVFAAGQETRTIQVTIVQDAIDEPNETVVLTLGDATNAGEVAPLTHVLTIIDDDLVCYGAPNSASDVCFDSAPTGDLVHGGGPIDTDTSPLCAAAQPIGWTPMQDAACVVARNSITISGGTSVFGTRPLVLVAANNISITSTLDASSKQGGVRGPAAPSALCKAFPTNPNNSTSGGGGGAGGSFMSAGGNGGTGNAGGTGAGTAATADAAAPVKLRAGCNGQKGGNNGGTQAGNGGFGGGAVYLVAGGMISFGNNGVVNVSGGGGSPGGNQTGGSGGGSGGMLHIFATGNLNVSNSTKLVANGGGGSSGGSPGSGGSAGSDPVPQTESTPASGGSGGGADGGDGFAGNTQAESGDPGPSLNGGGGGGGGGGYILSNKSLGNADVSAGVVTAP